MAHSGLRNCFSNATIDKNQSLEIRIRDRIYGVSILISMEKLIPNGASVLWDTILISLRNEQHTD